MKLAPEDQRRRVCQRCGVVFHAKPSKRRVFCSVGCRAEARRIRRKNDPRPCVVCGTLFMPSRSNGEAKYCSKSCAWKATRGPAFNALISRATATKRGDALRGSGEGKTYRKLNGRHEHRVVAERTLGRALRPGEVVHHIDGDKRNNAPGNLMVTTQRMHMREHGLGIPGCAPAHKPWEKRRSR